MAALTRRAAKPVGSVSGNQWRMNALPIQSGVTIRRGSVLIEGATGGTVDLAAAAFTANTILGVAAHAGLQGTAWYLGSTNQEDSGGTFGGDFMGASDLLGSVEGIAVHYAEAVADNVFEFCLDEALAAADLGAIVELELNSGLFSVSTATGGAEDFGTIVAIPNYPGVAIGDTNAPVHIIILASASALY